MERNRFLHISEIQALVEKYYPLSEEDWEPYTDTRPTTYPKWKHRLQSVLAEMKANDDIKHDPTSNSYMIPDNE